MVYSALASIECNLRHCEFRHARRAGLLPSACCATPFRGAPSAKAYQGAPPATLRSDMQRLRRSDRFPNRDTDQSPGSPSGAPWDREPPTPLTVPFPNGDIDQSPGSPQAHPGIANRPHRSPFLSPTGIQTRAQGRHRGAPWDREPHTPHAVLFPNGDTDQSPGSPKAAPWVSIHNRSPPSSARKSATEPCERRTNPVRVVSLKFRSASSAPPIHPSAGPGWQDQTSRRLSVLRISKTAQAEW